MLCMYVCSHHSCFCLSRVQLVSLQHQSACGGEHLDLDGRGRLVPAERQCHQPGRVHAVCQVRWWSGGGLSVLLCGQAGMARVDGYGVVSQLSGFIYKTCAAPNSLSNVWEQE